MRNKKSYWFIGLLVFALLTFAIYYFAVKAKQPPIKKPTYVKNNGVEISTDFNTNTFSSNQEALLLKDLQLCDSTLKWSEELNRPSCTPNFFRIFPLKKDLDLSVGCMVLLKAGVNGFPARRFIIYEKEGQELIQANGFVGYPIEFRPKKDNYDDLVIRFFERYQNEKYFYNCLFTWKQNRYQFVCCEQINDANIKPDKQAQVSAEVLQILNEKQLIF
jgi:hypothetical protein